MRSRVRPSTSPANAAPMPSRAIPSPGRTFCWESFTSAPKACSLRPVSPKTAGRPYAGSSCASISRRQATFPNSSDTTACCLPSPSPKLHVPEARRYVVLHHADGLHERVADGGADEAETAGLEVPAHRARLGCLRGDVGQGAGPVDDGLASHEPPQICVETAELPLRFEDPAGVPNGGLDLGPVADDTGIEEQAFYL